MKNYSLKNLTLYFLTLGFIGFGGSIALAHTMQEDLVKKRKWITQEEFTHGLTLSQLAPGPLATQLAMYIGFTMFKTLGATLAGIAFVLPSFLMVLAISVVYSHFGNLSFLQSALYGIGAAVIGIIASSGYSLTKQNMKRKVLLWIIFSFVFLFTLITHATNVVIFIIAGMLPLLVYHKEKVRLPKLWGFAITSPSAALNIITAFPLVKIFLFFLVAGSIAFGGGLAIVPFLQNGVVSQYHWLTNKQFVDAIAVAMITPGPVVIAATFIGYFAGNIPGALLATIAIFLPIYLIVIFLTPIFQRHAANAQVAAFIEGVLAAAMASIAASVILLGIDTIKDLPTILIAAISFALVRFFKLPSVVIILLAGEMGILLQH